jgi:hypothetical protein
VYQGHDGQVYVYVENGKGGRPREVQALPGQNEDVWTMHEGRPDDEKSIRADPAPPGCSFRPSRICTGTLPALRWMPPTDDRTAAEWVTWALGHNRIDVVLRHYIR